MALIKVIKDFSQLSTKYQLLGINNYFLLIRKQRNFIYINQLENDFNFYKNTLQ